MSITGPGDSKKQPAHWMVGEMHHPAQEGYFQFCSSLQPLCTVSCSPGTDEQPIAEQRHPVLVDKPSSARAAVQMKGEQPQLGSLEVGPAE